MVFICADAVRTGGTENAAAFFTAAQPLQQGFSGVFFRYEYWTRPAFYKMKLLCGGCERKAEIIAGAFFKHIHYPFGVK